MSENDMKELLESGQGAPRLGASHETNAGFGAPRDLGPGEVEQMFGSAQTSEQRLAAKGVEFVDSGTWE